MITTIPDRERALQAQVDALTAELARLRAVEPFGWFYDITNGDQKQGPIWQGGEDRKITEIVAEDIGAKVFPLYRAAPPAQPAEPVQLTEVEIFKAYTTATGKFLPNRGSSRAELVAITRIIERAHGIAAALKASHDPG